MTIRFPANADDLVTPRAGVWIEMSTTSSIKIKPTVTPRAGVWIEIAAITWIILLTQVTPRAGVWIEIKNDELSSILSASHSPCGSVD